MPEFTGAQKRPRPGHEWVDEIDDAVRGLASGFLVGIPVVFTVDSWWLGDQVTPLDALGQILARHQFHDEGAHPIALLEVVNGGDVGMIQRRECTGLAFESGEAVGILRQRGGQDLQRHVAPEPRVARPIHFAHPAGPEWTKHLIGTETGADVEHGSSDYMCGGDRHLPPRNPIIRASVAPWPTVRAGWPR